MHCKLKFCYNSRYGLRTNALLVLGLCLGWIFGMLAFKEIHNVKYQLLFGLLNGLQVIRMSVFSLLYLLYRCLEFYMNEEERAIKCKVQHMAKLLGACVSVQRLHHTYIKESKQNLLARSFGFFFLWLELLSF